MIRLHGLLLAGMAAAGLACAQAPARPGEPLVFAHRGASGERPEHTLGAYRLAMEQGADYVEPDLRMTRDGVFIALHDATLNRTTDVEGRPEFADRARVETNGVRHWHPEDFTLAEVKVLRARQGVKGRSAMYDLQESIPSLAEVVALVREFNRASGRKVGLVPELRGHADEFVRFVKDHALQDPAGPPLYLQSFELGTLKQVRPHLHAPCAWLLGDRPTSSQLADLKGAIDALAVSKKAVLEEGSAEWIRDVHAQGFKVIAWTFADDSYPRKQFAHPGDDLALALANGVDAFFTDHPASGVRVRATFLKEPRR